MVDMPYNPSKPNSIYLIYMYKEDLALNNLQGLISHETKPEPKYLKLLIHPCIILLSIQNNKLIGSFLCTLFKNKCVVSKSVDNTLFLRRKF